MSETVELKSAKGITNDSINGHSIRKGEKYLSSGVLQNCLVSISAKNF